MTTQQQLQDQTTPEFIKWCCEYADGFEWFEDTSMVSYNKKSSDYFYGPWDFSIFPLLFHRAVEGINYITNYDKEKFWILLNDDEFKTYLFKNYQSSTLTPCEMAIWHCLIDLFKEVEK